MSDTNFNELEHFCGVSDEGLSHRFKEAVRIENEIKKVNGLPIAKYDFEKNVPYVEYPDGRRMYAEEARNYNFSGIIIKRYYKKKVSVCENERKEYKLSRT